MDIYLKQCDVGDFEDFYVLRCDHENIYWTGYKNEPEKEKLNIWFQNQIKRDDRKLFLAKINQKEEVCAGYLYIDVLESTESAEISYGVDSKHAGRGIGTKIVALAIDYIIKSIPSVKSIFAWIIDSNTGSIKCVSRNGFVKSGKYKSVYLESMNRSMIMNEYILKIKDNAIYV